MTVLTVGQRTNERADKPARTIGTPDIERAIADVQREIKNKKEKLAREPLSDDAPATSNEIQALVAYRDELKEQRDAQRELELTRTREEEEHRLRARLAELTTEYDATAEKIVELGNEIHTLTKSLRPKAREVSIIRDAIEGLTGERVAGPRTIAQRTSSGVSEIGGFAQRLYQSVRGL